ncbi:unnamed protein product [Rotaria socialis]|uniref:TIR domain-containing protein n=1 Tax=Rotaria socialis TaxID=392032 RepID=A0A818A366_9BILA|nr:unnamed protein product [Rotaria socialis]CAF3398694.1 unnamed protein product [Rotaria socialis]CAF4112130.1 unnamed protein product [Rotaria socialis]CAF4455630.1 unnamed protein product [Rotaria socialis]
MGCAASNNNVVTTSTHVIPVPIASNTKMLNIDASHISSVSNKHTTNILIASHTTQQTISEKLGQKLVDQCLSCYLLNETTPQSLSARANAIQWCDVFVVVISRFYQRTPFCMEALNYAKDRHKPIIAILAECTFRPYGALGAIVASAIRSIVLSDHASFLHAVSEIIASTRTEVLKKKDPLNVTDLSQINDNNMMCTLHRGSSTCTVLICTTDDGDSVGRLIHESLLNTQLSLIVENLSKPDATCSVTQCTVFMPILTPQLEQTPLCRAALEQARLHCKQIVPVIAAKKWRPEGWLGLVIAGRVFFRIFDQETANKPFYDSNRITDLRVATEIACQPFPSETEREAMEKNALQIELDMCKSKLSIWPPKRKSHVINPMKARQPVRVQLQEPHADSYFEHTHHSITRITFKAPPAIVDQYGLPKRKLLDCMISYQWGKQNLVREIYEDLRMRNVETWFDIWGSMQGSTNDAMATGVECAKVILVFLSKEYTESTNCRLELQYSVQRGKAFVILHTEPNIALQQWILEAIEGFPQYDVYTYDVLKQLINGVPMIDVIVQAVRSLVQAQPPDPVDDCSTEVFELRSLLDDARDALSAETGEMRYRQCTRCGQQYDNYSKDGCKKHSAYYLGGGGGLLEDQWVCCRQQTTDSPGCVSCEHIDQPRVFVEDPSYGTSTWKSA